MTVSAVRDKTFTREQASRTLPLVRLIVRDIVDLYTDLQSRAERLDAISARRRRKQNRENDPYADEVREMQARFAADEKTLQQLIAELTELGVRLSDAGGGAVMFQGQGETRYEWRLGDDDVRTIPVDTTFNLYTPPALTDDSEGLIEKPR
jgi:hypothetical protein